MDEIMRAAHPAKLSFEFPFVAGWSIVGGYACEIRRSC